MVKKYKGKLKEPLPPLPDILFEPDYDEAIAGYNAEVAERLELLFKHHGISGRSDGAWRALAVSLAKAHVPGLKPHEPKTDPDIFLSIFFHMFYLIRFRGLSERQASEVLSQTSPDLGKPEKIRSRYKGFEHRRGQKSLQRLFARIEDERGLEALEFALEGELGEKVSEFRDIKPTARGRPKKK